MKIILTSIAWTEVNDIFSKATAPLEFLLNNLFDQSSYGADVTQFMAIAIAVGAPEENEKFSKTRNKSGTFKHPITNEKVKYISLSLLFDPECVQGKNEKQLSDIFCNALLKRLDKPDIKIPKGFDYERFSTDIKNALIKMNAKK